MTGKIMTSVETITPTDAAKYLANNAGNRNIKRTVTDRYAHDMRQGQWRMNGEPVMFNGNGGLIDGQHRMQACIEAGVAFDSVVVRGLPASVMPTINTGSARTLADVLGIQGLTNVKVVASTVSWVMRYDDMLAAHRRQLAPGYQFSRTDELKFVRQNKEALLDTANLIIEHQPILLGPPSVFAFAHFIASRDSGASQKRVDDFVKYAADPAGLRPDDGPVVLRTWLLNQQAGYHRKRAVAHYAAVTFKAYRAWTQNLPIVTLKWARSKKFGDEAFPVMSDRIKKK